jgi:NAD(P)-dependent dehydrogenase (short-subunit alcohol dehydrogenase family)
MRLEGKTAIIIGAGQTPGATIGNGRATALRFAQEGAKVMAVDHHLASAEETARMVEKEGGDCFAFQADVTKESTLKAAIEAAQERWGHIDILHYNVGSNTAAGDKPLLDMTEEIFDRLIAINLRGAVMACKQVIPIMRQQRSGAIVTTGSVAAFDNIPNVGYKAAKAGLDAFTKQLAIQNAAFGIRANSVVPGSIDTPMGMDIRVRMSGANRDELKAKRAAVVPLQRMGSAWDIANAALFLASDEASFITGVSLVVDGGWLVSLSAVGQ